MKLKCILCSRKRDKRFLERTRSGSWACKDKMDCYMGGVEKKAKALKKAGFGVFLGIKDK